jgi:preprotein translocase subunit SecG
MNDVENMVTSLSAEQQNAKPQDENALQKSLFIIGLVTLFLCLVFGFLWRRASLKH